MTNTSACKLLSPALPSELLAYVLKQHAEPTALILCSSRASFVASLLDEVRNTSPTDQPLDHSKKQKASDHSHQDEEPERRDATDSHPRASSSTHDKHLHLLTSPLHQLAVSKHIRTLYMPTVTHLRAYLSVCGVPGDREQNSLMFFSSSSVVPAPPQTLNLPSAPSVAGEPETNTSGTLVVYGFLDLHRDTSEWSGQGLSQSISTLVETAHQLALRNIVLIEPAQRQQPQSGSDRDEGGGNDHGWEDEDKFEDEGGYQGSGPGQGHSSTDVNRGRRFYSRLTLEEVLTGNIPLLTGSGTSALRKLGLDGDEPGWAGRTVEVGRVLHRWMCFQQGEWM